MPALDPYSVSIFFARVHVENEPSLFIACKSQKPNQYSNITFSTLLHHTTITSLHPIHISPSTAVVTMLLLYPHDYQLKGRDYFTSSLTPDSATIFLPFNFLVAHKVIAHFYMTLSLSQEKVQTK